MCDCDPKTDSLASCLSIQEIQKGLSERGYTLHYDEKAAKSLVPFLSPGFNPSAGSYQIMNASGDLVASFQTWSGLCTWLKDH